MTVTKEKVSELFVFLRSALAKNDDGLRQDTIIAVTELDFILNRSAVSVLPESVTGEQLARIPALEKALLDARMEVEREIEKAKKLLAIVERNIQQLGRFSATDHGAGQLAAWLEMRSEIIRIEG